MYFPTVLLKYGDNLVQNLFAVSDGPVQGVHDKAYTLANAGWQPFTNPRHHPLGGRQFYLWLGPSNICLMT